MNSHEKLLYAICNNGKDENDPVRAAIRPAMLHPSPYKSIFKKWYDGWEPAITEGEMEILSRYRYDHTGFIPIVPEQLIKQLKIDFEPQLKTLGLYNRTGFFL